MRDRAEDKRAIQRRERLEGLMAERSQLDVLEIQRAEGRKDFEMVDAYKRRLSSLNGRILDAALRGVEYGERGLGGE